MLLYKVSFTTKKIVTRYGAKREILSEIEEEVPVTIGGLPLATAQGYSHCDNFQMEKQFAQAETKVSYRKSGRGGRAYREVEVGIGRGEVNVATAGKKAKSKLDAAASGDMGAALS